jgi:hypothetical protein
MRTKALAIMLLAGALTAAGCGDDDNARAYAKKLGVVLKAYHEQVNQKVRAEQESYKRLAGVYGRAQDEDARESLWLERNELAQQIADQLKGGKPSPSVTEIRALLKKYADTDVQLMRKLLEREGIDNTESLGTLVSLDVETQKIEALTKALDTLAEPKSTRQQLKELAAFAGQVDAEFKKLVCADLAQQIKDVQDQKKAAEDEAKKPGLSETQKEAMAAKIKRLEALASELGKRKTANKCA